MTEEEDIIQSQANYCSRSDQKWKSKSLNSLPLQRYAIELGDRRSTKPLVNDKDNKKVGKSGLQGAQGSREQLPAPKINKINENMFCISVYQQVNLLYMADREERAKMKVKKTFGVVQHKLDKNVVLVTGNGSNHMFVMVDHGVIVLLIYRQEDRFKVGQVGQLHISNLRIINALQSELIAVSNSHVYRYTMEDKDGQLLFTLATKNEILFLNKEEEVLFARLNAVGILVGSSNTLYYFGSVVQERAQLGKQARLSASDKMLSESLYIVKLARHDKQGRELQRKSSLSFSSNKDMTGKSRLQVHAELFAIDLVFEVGIFSRSKIYQIQQQVFLMSLHEEIILIKANFRRFIVWDNVSVVSSKSQTKKGQLILADQKILVYSENTQIYAHEIFFDTNESKLSMPAIDSFRGNDNVQEILYDAVLLEYEQDSLMKVLLYVHPSKVWLAGHSNHNYGEETEEKEELGLQFSVICINQSDPKEKLKQLLSKGKTAQQLQIFCSRFNISVLEKTKCMWSVSEKKLKDIENVLLQISDDDYIQTELDDILKKEPHSLNFLISVENRQIGRLKKLLVMRLLELVNKKNPKGYLQSAKKEVKEVNAGEITADDGSAEQGLNKIIQWLMESIMFEKKLNYSKNFLAFKEYDFIQIGKLKAASLKEEIKLLSCKKYEKRLKYFLNSFKVLAIANFEEVFEFLLLNKNEHEVEEFIKDFRFLLPSFAESSDVFISQPNLKVFEKQKIKFRTTVMHRTRPPNSSLRKEELDTTNLLTSGADWEEREEHCSLWDDLDDSVISETIEYFEANVKADIVQVCPNEPSKSQAIAKFRTVMSQFIERPWFQTAAFKQHSMITKSSQQLHSEFLELKRKGVFKIIVKLLFQKVHEGTFEENRINKMLDNFVAERLIPDSFKRNVDARRHVYSEIFEQYSQKQKKTIELPPLPDFITCKEEEYFSLLFQHVRSRILTDVKRIYEQIIPGFFRERFQVYLQSSLVCVEEIISFLDEFSEGRSNEQVIRLDVFNAIKKLLKIQDYEHTKTFIHKILEKEMLHDGASGRSRPHFDQVKISYAFSYYQLFKVLNLDYTYEQLIRFTKCSSMSENGFLQTAVGKYCRDELSRSKDTPEQCVVSFDGSTRDEKLPDVDIYQQPLEFLSVMLCLLEELEFQVSPCELYKLFIENYLSQGKFEELRMFVSALEQYYIGERSLQSKNYTLVTSFKMNNKIIDIFKNYVLDWINRNYQQIKEVRQADSRLAAAEKGLALIAHFDHNAPTIRKEKAFHTIMLQLKIFSPVLLTRVDYLRQEMRSQSAFLFLMHIFEQIGMNDFVGSFPDYSASIDRLFCLFDAYKEVNTLQKVSLDHPQFLRFLVQACLQAIWKNQFSLASYLLGHRIPSDKYYFRGVLFLFFSYCNRDESKALAYREDLSRMIIAPETTSLLRQNIAIIIETHGISKFISGEAAAKRCLEMFDMIMAQHRYDDAFFFLVRAKMFPSVQTNVIIRNRYKKGLGSVENHRHQVEAKAYLVLVSYMNCLQAYIAKKFYPTFSFFEAKWNMLVDQRARRDVIKDINIAISRISISLSQAKQQDTSSELMSPKLQKDKEPVPKAHAQLRRAYQQYMQAIGENPDIELIEENQCQEGRIFDTFENRIGQEVIAEEERERMAINRNLQQNIESLGIVQYNNRMNVLNKQVIERISEIKKAGEGHSFFDQDLPKERISYAEQKALEIEKVKRNEQGQLEEVRDHHTSDTARRVQELLNNLKKKKEEIMQRPTVRILEQKHTKEIAPTPSLSEDIARRVQLQTGNYLARNNIAPQPQLNREQLLIGLQRKMFGPEDRSGQPVSMKKKPTLESVVQLYRQEESGEALNCVQKYDLLRSVQARIELVKRVYSVTANIRNFLQYLKFLLAIDATWSESVEEKSIHVGQQMAKMNEKSGLNLKELIPGQFFTTTSKTTLKDYSAIAFELIRPCLRKVFEKEMLAVHAVGILFRYSLGNDNKYYNQVFLEYFKVLFRNYELRVSDEKDTFLLAQKIRANYSNLPQPKNQSLGTLLNSLGNTCREKLIEALRKALQRKGADSLLGSTANEQIQLVILNLTGKK